MGLHFKNKIKSILLIIAYISSSIYLAVLGPNEKLLNSELWYTKLWYRLSVFFGQWGIYQWFLSIFVSVIIYILVLKYWNTRVKKKSQNTAWLLTYSRMFGAICLDFSLNLTIGLYYVYDHSSLLGIFMLMCPIAISPIIFIIMFICYIIYCKKKC